jgi:hypothetical protein
LLKELSSVLVAAFGGAFGPWIADKVVESLKVGDFSHEDEVYLVSSPSSKLSAA